MTDQRKQQAQQSGQRDQHGGIGHKPGQQDQQQTNYKPGQAGEKQEELNKKWREIAEPGQEPGTGEPGT